MMLRMGELILIRHGETEWSRSGKHTGRTDLPLTEAGRAAAITLRPALAARHITAAFVSPASRAIQTAELAGLTGAKFDPDLWEWDYGGYEGLTTDQIRKQRPSWYLWRDGIIPGDAAHPGETAEQVGARSDAVLRRVRPLLRRRRCRAGSTRPPAPGTDSPLARAGAGRGQAFPPRHRYVQHARRRARAAGHQLVERPAARPGQRCLAGCGRGTWLIAAG